MRTTTDLANWIERSALAAVLKGRDRGDVDAETHGPRRRLGPAHDGQELFAGCDVVTRAGRDAIWWMLT